jgi:transposase
MIPAIEERCAGIDVHKKFVMVCALAGPAHAEPEMKIRRFGTCNAELVQLREWLEEMDCRHVVMESTGPYWKPVFNVLEEAGVKTTLANPQQVKNLRGHKTDMKDCQWLAHLLRHGLIRPSYIPPGRSASFATSRGGASNWCGMELWSGTECRSCWKKPT